MIGREQPTSPCNVILATQERQDLSILFRSQDKHSHAEPPTSREATLWLERLGLFGVVALPGRLLEQATGPNWLLRAIRGSGISRVELTALLTFVP